MENETKGIIVVMLIIVIGILLFTGLISFAIYKSREMRIANFENVIDNLTDEQKCLHICGYEFHNYFDRYKFCIEKCDRISERMAKECK